MIMLTNKLDKIVGFRLCNLEKENQTKIFVRTKNKATTIINRKRLYEGIKQSKMGASIFIGNIL